MPELKDEAVREWVDTELDREFPKPEQLLSGMALDVEFRDVTYQTLNEPGFAEVVKEAYPHVDLDKPFDEFQRRERP